MNKNSTVKGFSVHKIHQEKSMPIFDKTLNQGKCSTQEIGVVSPLSYFVLAKKIFFQKLISEEIELLTKKIFLIRSTLSGNLTFIISHPWVSYEYTRYTVPSVFTFKAASLFFANNENV